MRSSNEKDTSEDSDEVDECRAKRNGIEGKDPMDQDEEDWGEKIEFGFHENRKRFPQTWRTISCFLRTSAQSDTLMLAGYGDTILCLRQRANQANPQDIVALVEKYGEWGCPH